MQRTDAPVLTLASASAVRAQILRGAGVPFRIERSGVDEAPIKDALVAQGAGPEEIAQKLADAKTADVAARDSGLVLGADQILWFDERLYDKATNLDEARERLWKMRGKPHQLVGAISFARDGEIIHRHTQRSTILMRDFSEAFLDHYFAEEGEVLLSSVACYRFEGLGAQLFERVDGDFHAILGLPLLPVLDFLRAEGALIS